MTVIVSQKNNFTQAQIENVTSISYANNTYTIVAGGVSMSYSKDNYVIFIIN